MIVLLGLAGCWEPSETGPNGMAARVFDSRGLPIVGLRVESLEAADLTDDEGYFAVQYQAPNDGVGFRFGGAHWSRAYRAGDAGQVLELHLPSLRDASLRCDLEAEAVCDLRWEDDGLLSRLTIPCEPGKVVSILGIPVGAPEVSCRTGPAAPAHPVQVIDGAVIRLLDPPRQIRVELRADEGDLPVDCQLVSADTRGEDAGGGVWTIEASPQATVFALCDGRPSPPAVVAGAELVTLVWSALGPELDVEPIGLAPTQVEMLSETHGWRIQLPLTAGTVALPRLLPGRYRILGGGAMLLGPVESPDGVALLRERREDAFVVDLVLVADLVGGSLEVRER